MLVILLKMKVCLQYIVMEPLIHTIVFSSTNQVKKQAYEECYARNVENVSIVQKPFCNQAINTPDISDAKIHLVV